MAPDDIVITWLHICDLQLRSPRFSNQDDVLLSLLSDIEERMRADRLRPDFIAVTGDVAYSGQDDEYKQAIGFFDRLLKTTRLGTEQLFLVPGNHDQNRDQGPSRELNNYLGFVDGYLGGGFWLDQENTFYVRAIDIAGQLIVIMGLNTVEAGELSPGVVSEMLGVAEQQASPGKAQRSDGVVKIALSHRSLRGAISLLDNCDFVLHGHAEDGARRGVVEADFRAIVINGGSDPQIPEHPSAYNFVRLDLESGTGQVFFRRYEPKIREWVADMETGNMPDGLYTFSLRLDLVSRPPLKQEDLEPEEEEGPPPDEEPTPEPEGDEGLSFVEEPSPEPTVIREWTPPLPAYATDIASGKDKLGIMRDVRAFSSVFAAEDTDPPLCLGLFGDWGSGKTFFMNKMREEIARLADHARQAEKDGEPTSYHSRIVQIDFNAWHYIDSNLWASLVSHIFDELAKFITEERQEQEKAQLFKELETAKELLKEAEREQKAARANLTGAEEQLEQARKAREDASLELRDLRGYTLEKLFKEDAELKTKLETASEQIGLSSAIESAEQLNDTVGELHTLWGLVRTSLRKTPDRQAWFAFAFLVFLAIPLTALGINWVLDKFLDSPQLISNIYFVLTQVATILVSINRWLKPVSGAVSTLEDVRNEFNQRLQKKRRTLTEEEKTKMARLSVLQEQEQAARKALNEAQERFDRAKVAVNELEGIEDGRLLAEFIQERVTSEDYKKHLGIISKVHDDFDALSKLLGGDTEQESDLPRIDRIILYIDDLDRCPEDKVMEVLQAVHLLLAFRLFIVVVGVDSRWLLCSLEEFYPALQTRATERTALLDEEVLAWESTPQNYLEKIFQIPFYLRPMSRQGFQKLVASILPPLGEREEPRPEARPAETIQPVVSAEQQDVPLPVPQEGDLQIEPSKPTSVQLGPSEEEVPPPPPPTPPPAEPEEEEEREVNLTPPALEIREEERKFASSLSALVPTPRAVKRFINIYRLIRVKIPESDLARFVGSEEEPGEFRVVMILLATLTGFPRQAPYVFNEIRSLDPKLPWRNLVETLKPRRIPETEPERFRNGVVPNMSAAETNEWIRLYAALRELAPTLPDTMEIYKGWAPEVARFSFRVGKIAESRSLPSDVTITHVEYNPPGDDVEGEYVEIENQGDIAELMTDWALSDVAQNTYTFPTFTLPARGKVRVWVRHDTDTATDLYWGRKAAVWNNRGDTAYLRDANGNLVSTYSWP
jgi:predicted phosphodiesterase